MVTSSALNAPQQALFAKAAKINSCCETYKDDTVKVPHFYQLCSMLAFIVPKIEVAEHAKRMSRNTTSMTKEKQKRMKALILKSDGLAAVMRVDAGQSTESEREAQLQKMFKSKLKAMPHDLMVDAIAGFIDYLLGINLDDLAKYAITKTELTDLQTECNAVRAFFKEQQTANEQKSTDQENLGALISELDGIISDMTGLMSRFITIAPKFYTAFNRLTTLQSKIMAKAKKKKQEKAPLKVKKAPSKKKMPPENPENPV